jgi:ADP-ribose pyrophosphatase YjhB (NUDIX family)
MVWKPHVTVAAIIEQDGRFLLVEETTETGIAFNQPAGHLEPGEDLINAVKREVLEETAWHFKPEALSGIQLWRKNSDSPSFVRFCFTGTVDNHSSNQKLDEGIIATHWLTADEVLIKKSMLRSPLVHICIEEYLKGQRYPLSIVQSFLDLA